MKTELVKSEMDSAITRNQTDTPYGVGDAVSTSDGEMRFDFSRHDEPDENCVGEEADYGDSDGGDMRKLARPNRTSILTMKRPSPVLATGKCMGDKRQRRMCGMSVVRRRGNGEASRQQEIASSSRDANMSTEFRKRIRCEIQESIEKRRRTSDKRKRSAEGLAMVTPFYEVKTREVDVEEIQEERRALEQELAGMKGPSAIRGGGSTRAGGIPIVCPTRYQTGPKPFGQGERKGAMAQSGSASGALDYLFRPNVVSRDISYRSKSPHRQAYCLD